MLQGGSHRKVDCHALITLIKHADYGWILWDTGYAPRMFDATRAMPYRLYRYATPLRIRPDLAAIHQLERFGIGPGDIRRVIISHFHADHIAGLRDFPHAELVASRTAYEGIAGRRGVGALRQAFIPALLPDDIAARLTLLPVFTGEPLPGVGPTYDLFGDGTIRLVALPGHARGQIGALLETEQGPVLLAADGCWHSRAYRERRLPNPITKLLVDDWQAVRKTIDGLHAFARARPDVLIIPTHCPEVYERLVAHPIPGE
jgi:glyoxylase-like metal-dependent hydrolase (beta-lactamase superfamily II)